MCISFTGFGIPEISIDNIEQYRFGITVKGLNIIKAFNCFFIITGVEPFLLKREYVGQRPKEVATRARGQIARYAYCAKRCVSTETTR